MAQIEFKRSRNFLCFFCVSFCSLWRHRSIFDISRTQIIDVFQWIVATTNLHFDSLSIPRLIAVIPSSRIFQFKWKYFDFLTFIERKTVLLLEWETAKENEYFPFLGKRTINWVDEKSMASEKWKSTFWNIH